MVLVRWLDSVGLSLQNNFSNNIWMYPTTSDVLISLVVYFTKRWLDKHTHYGFGVRPICICFQCHNWLLQILYTQMSFQSVCKEDSRIFSMQFHLLTWQRICHTWSFMFGLHSFKLVALFCNKYGNQVPPMEDDYMPCGGSRRFATI